MAAGEKEGWQLPNGKDHLHVINVIGCPSMERAHVSKYSLKFLILVCTV